MTLSLMIACLVACVRSASLSKVSFDLVQSLLLHLLERAGITTTNIDLCPKDERYATHNATVFDR